MWTVFFLCLAVLLLISLALAYAYALFEKRAEARRNLWWAAAILAAAAYCGWRAFW